MSTDEQEISDKLGAIWLLADTTAELEAARHAQVRAIYNAHDHHVPVTLIASTAGVSRVTIYAVLRHRIGS